MAENAGLNVTIDRSPKCHPDVAGEGVEYTRANCKLYFRGVPLVHARDYIVMYHIHEKMTSSASAVSPTVNELSHIDIQKTTKIYRSHCGVERGDLRWIMSTLGAEKNCTINTTKC
eukprot:6428293-Ditylum_brightwellii.AAC.2